MIMSVIRENVSSTESPAAEGQVLIQEEKYLSIEPLFRPHSYEEMRSKISALYRNFESQLKNPFLKKQYVVCRDIEYSTTGALASYFNRIISSHIK